MRAFVAVLAILLAGCGFTVQDARDQVRKLSSDGGYASAVVLSPGLVLTAQHVAAHPGLKLREDGAVGEVVFANEKVDIAIMAFPVAEAACPCATLAAYEALPDETVYFIGYPFNVAQVAAEGLSQGVQEKVVLRGPWGQEDDLGRRLVIHGQAGPGNSGGGVFVYRNGEFQLVGIVAEGAGALTFAVSIADIRAALARVL